MIRRLSDVFFTSLFPVFKASRKINVKDKRKLRIILQVFKSNVAWQEIWEVQGD